jgi:hypothetical protein
MFTTKCVPTNCNKLQTAYIAIEEILCVKLKLYEFIYIIFMNKEIIFVVKIYSRKICSRIMLSEMIQKIIFDQINNYGKFCECNVSENKNNFKFVVFFLYN